MIQTFNELIAYLKNPVLEEDNNKDSNYRMKKFFHLLIISLLTGMAASLLIFALDEFGLVNMDNHQVEEMMKNLPKIAVLLFAVGFAPIIEEAIFRAPLTLFTDPKTFRVAFYIIAILFGFMHITNYKLTANILLFSPILVLPQILVGLYFGFIRVRFGFLWGVALHAAYNGILTLMAFVGEYFFS